MNKVKFDSDLMKLMTHFESVTGANVKDCIANDKIIFIIEGNEMGKAIGKNGANIKRVENSLKKKIKLVEFTNDVSEFVKNLVYPIEVADVKNEDGNIIIHAKDTNTKAMLIGRERKNINNLTATVKRYFNIKEAKVI